MLFYQIFCVLGHNSDDTFFDQHKQFNVDITLKNISVEKTNLLSSI